MTNKMADLATLRSGRSNPLQEAEMSAKSPVMRELARIALMRGYRQETLAKALAKTTGSSVTSANVGRHFFNTDKPRADTLRSYAAVLRIPIEYTDLLTGTFTDRQRQVWDLRLWRDLEEHDRFLKPGWQKAIGTALERLGRGAADEALRRYGVAWHRFMMDAPEQNAQSLSSIAQALKLPLELGEPIIAFAGAVKPSLDFATLVRLPKKNEGLLSGFWIDLFNTGLFTLDEIDALVELVAAALRSKHLDTQSMESRLRSERAKLVRDIAAGSKSERKRK